MRAISVATILLAVASSACGGSDVVRLDATDNGTTVEVTTEDQIEIALEGNPTTGFTWEILEALGVRQIGDSTHLPASDLVGAPGTTTFVFEPLGEGETDLTLVYHRAWEEEPPLESFAVHLVINR